MRIQKFGLELRSVKKEDLELIRKWRNNKTVRSKMIFQDIINPSDQLKWFNSLGNQSCYLLIEWNRKPIGLINVKNIDWKNRIGEAGIFVGDEVLQNHFAPILAIHAVMEAFFNEFRFEGLKARTRKDNLDAIEMNLALGYQKVAETEVLIEFSINKKAYFEKRMSINPWLEKQRSKSDVIVLEQHEEQLFLKNSE